MRLGSRSRVVALWAGALALWSATGCAREVKRVDTKEVIDLSGRWNDSDSRFVSEQMINECLGGAWIKEHTDKAGKKPVVTIGRVLNKSSDHISTETFINDLRRAMINSGKIAVVASQQQREELRQEREDQAINARETDQKAAGKELGADYLLKGVINSIEDAEGSEKVVFYQIDLELWSITDNTIIWTGQKKIKKFFERNSVRY